MGKLGRDKEVNYWAKDKIGNLEMLGQGEGK